MPSTLHLKVLFHDTDQLFIDFSIFYHLPKHLTALEIRAPQTIPQDPKELVFSLPKRLMRIEISFPISIDFSSRDWYEQQERILENKKRHRLAVKNLKAALLLYYSDPFWNTRGLKKDRYVNFVLL